MTERVETPPMTPQQICAKAAELIRNQQVRHPAVGCNAPYVTRMLRTAAESLMRDALSGAELFVLDELERRRGMQTPTVEEVLSVLDEAAQST